MSLDQCDSFVRSDDELPVAHSVTDLELVEQLLNGAFKRRAQALVKRFGGEELTGFDEVRRDPLLCDSDRIMLSLERYVLDAELRARMQSVGSLNRTFDDDSRTDFGTDSAAD